MNKWYEEASVNNDVVISSRVRLARNLRDLPFHDFISEREAEELVKKIRGYVPFLQEKDNAAYYSCSVNRLGEVERTAMVEWHIISPQLAEKKQETGLILSEDEGISIMINEEDHLRIQSMVNGMDIKKALHHADVIDNILGEVLPIAFHERYGYLTTCPSNTGTGLRASYMLFLPALTMDGKIQKLADEVSKYGVTIRGIYGEGTKSLGYMYQISNQKTLGSSENEIIESLNEIVMQVIRQERRRREYVLSVNAGEVEDKVYRSYGVLKYAKLLNAVDAMMLLSQVKLGADTGILKLKNKPNFHRIMMEIQPASLQKHYGKSIGGSDRDRYRAMYLNERVPGLA